ncbi:AbrB/MazE/SpoVT family DNA-binding domain-containing protein [Ruminococcus sp.]|uniref:AbrB/MazE/SpoVT family DNA-binding domain-containing protein n=1 Tax=Ruminococcus sp. TaxID=41978 RepID=UPI0025EF67F3|nr:AbrB/MazE/SpoVT family DNA-binding domain-containing protein [Ruminococcus sp.]MBQ6252464.1 AbrB/MazE/SpoVT family DNA-binding domain-containing protein [Ruminococcus sp.]
MITNVQKWGNSQGIRIPKSILSELNFTSDQPVELIVDDGQLIIKKASTNRKTIRELFENYTGDYNCSEIDWGERVGNEEW